MNNWGSGTINIAQGTIELSGSNSNLAYINIESGTTLLAGGINAFSPTYIHNQGTLNLAGYSNTIGYINSTFGGGTGNILLGSGTLTLSANTGTQTLTGAISGVGGSLNLQGGGTLVLSGTTSYTGTTTIGNGTILKIGAASGALTSSVDVATGGTFNLNNYPNSILGLSGGGNVQLGSASLTFQNSSPSTFTGAISGNGGLVMAGTSTQTLQGTNTYLGQTTISSGTLAITSANSIGGASTPALLLSGGTLHSMGNVTLPQGINVTTSSGILTDPTYTTDVSGLVTGSNGAILTLSGTGTTIIESVAVNGSDSFTLAGVISGSHTLTKSGTGTLILTGVNTYLGQITISAGTLSIAAGNNIGPETLSLGGSTLLVTGNASVSQAVNITASSNITTEASFTATFLGTLTGAGGTTLTLGGAGTNSLASVGVNSSDLFTLAGAIGGTEAFEKVGTGTLILTGTNTYSGRTKISGGTLSIASASNIGPGILELGGGTLQPSATLSLSQSIDVTDNSSITTGSSLTTTFSSTLTGSTGTTLTLNGPGTNSLGSIAVNSTDSFTIAGVIGGSQTLDKLGTGTLTLTGTNIYSGGTTLSEGTLSISSLNNIAEASPSLTLAGGTLHASGNLPISTNVSVTGNSHINTDSSFTTTLSGTLTGSNGSTLTLSGAGINSLGSIAVNGSDSLTVAGVIAGSQTVVKSGTGTLILSGANTYSEGTQIAAGTLSIGASNNVSTGGILFTGSSTLQFNTTASYSMPLTVSSSGITASFDTEGVTATLTTPLPTVGMLDKIGSGTLKLSTTNTYSGINILAGTLQAGVANAFSPDAPVVLSNTTGVFLDLNNYPNTIPSLAGGGALGGTVSLGSATLTVGNSTSTTFSGAISGTGGISKVGTGTLTLAGFNNDYTGPTNIALGVLVVNGVIESSLTTVHPGATLQGVGLIIGDVTVDNNATIHIGNSIGNFEIDGNLTLNSMSVFTTEINPSNNSFLLVGGTAHLAGTLSVTVDSGLYAQGTQYVLLLADAGLDGTQFNSTTFTQADFPGTISYVGGSVLLTLMSAAGQVSIGMVTGNSLATGNYLNSLPMNLFDSVADSLAGLSESQTAAALLTINPSRDAFATYVVQNNAFSIAKMISTRMNHRQNGLILHEDKFKDVTAMNPLFHKSSPKKEVMKKESKRELTYDIWISDFGNWGQQNAQEQNPTFRFTTRGSLVGVDLDPFREDLFLGAMTGYFMSSIQDYNGFGNQSIQSFVFGAYGIGTVKDFFIESYLGACYNRVKGYRDIVFTGFDETAESKFNTWQFIPHAKFGYNWDLSSVILTPFVSLDVPITFQESYQEQGAGIFSMQVNSRTAPFLQLLVGLSTTETFDLSSCLIVFKQEAGYIFRAPFKAGTTTAAVIGAPSTFQVVSFTTDEHIADLSCDLFIKHPTKGFFGFFSADGQIGSGYKSLDLFGGIGLEF
jgi:autotransporter-associated beta strand protein